jgi:hypothetical protein
VERMEKPASPRSVRRASAAPRRPRLAERTQIYGGRTRPAGTAVCCVRPDTLWLAEFERPVEHGSSSSRPLTAHIRCRAGIDGRDGQLKSWGAARHAVWSHLRTVPNTLAHSGKPTGRISCAPCGFERCSFGLCEEESARTKSRVQGPRLRFTGPRPELLPSSGSPLLLQPMLRAPHL